ncbi:MAG: tetratricopeptide repeat protein [Ignavibacteria bacterium]|jgi:cytochrome c-type biogenesis protein CcmH/NrfG|nr:tetratricopeptide repeat protein [Ignavibacteria bacterium]MDH7527077.1 tetratricopeptide repeat protein [Ignavibacteria bacterium]
MKFQIKYLYLILGLVVVGMIAYFVVSKEAEKSNQTQIPDDEIHRGLRNKQSMQMDKELLSKIDSLKQIVNNNPKDTIALNHLGFFLLQAHKFDEAETYFENLLKINPDRLDVLNVLAEVNFNLQKFDKSENYLKKIIRLEKNNEVAKYNLGVVYVMQGKKDEARKVWTELVKSNPNSDLGKMAKESLEGLQ